MEVKQFTERLIEACYVAGTVSACQQFGEAAMKLPRRQFLHLAAAAATFPALSRFASAQSYPTRPVHLLEGFGAGGAPDIVARLIGQSLSERLGQSFVVENRQWRLPATSQLRRSCGHLRTATRCCWLTQQMR